MSDQSRITHFSSGFADLDEVGKTHIEKMLSQLSEQPHSPELLPASNQENPLICKPAANELQLRKTNE
jgi:hypothetical protein